MTRMHAMAMGMLRAALVAVALVAAGGAAAQDSVGVPSSEAIVVRDAGGPPIQAILPLNKARIVRLPADARDVIMTNPSIADVIMKSARTAYVLGQEVGDTNVLFLDASGEEVARIELRVDLDVMTLQAAMESLIPDERVKVSSMNNNIVLSGTVSTPEVAENARQIASRFARNDENVVNLLSVRTKSQVLLKVRVSEMNRQVLKQLGVDISGQVTGGDTVFSFLQNTPITNAVTSTGLLVGEGNDFVEAVFDNLERTGLIKILAEPSVTAISGETAGVLVGGEFPVPVAQQDNTISIEFKQFGIALNFTPVVLDPAHINLQVSTEVSQLSDQGAIQLENIVVPALAVRRANTTVNLPSGGSLVIAGLLQSDIRNTIDGFPGLKDVPVLGMLFRSVDFQRDESELVITVTPYLVRPVAEAAITLPTDGFAPASDADMFFLGRLNHVYAPAKPVGEGGSLGGPIGYILE